MTSKKKISELSQDYDTAKCLPHLFWCHCHFHSVKYFTNSVLSTLHFYILYYSSYTLIEQSPMHILSIIRLQNLIQYTCTYPLHSWRKEEWLKSLVFDPNTHHRLHNISDPANKCLANNRVSCSLHTRE